MSKGRPISSPSCRDQRAKACGDCRSIGSSAIGMAQPAPLAAVSTASAKAQKAGKLRSPKPSTISGTPAKGRSAAEMEQGLRREVRRVVDEGVTQEELERVKAQAIAAQVYQRDSMFFQARQIGWLETVGLSYRDEKLFIEKLQQVTAEQMRDVARRYLLDDGLTVAYLDPQPLNAAPARAAPPAGVRHGN